jgi:isoleucyl-tRNA synthetase
LEPTYNAKVIESEVRAFWDKAQIRNAIEEQRSRENIGRLGFVEGPPTLNGRCHVGHSRGRAIKDAWYRLKTMQGYYVLYRAGWDTQGLPVELEVERELGLTNKREIGTKVSLESFIAEVKKTVEKYHEAWLSVDRKFGMFLDYDKEYMTYRDAYIEREWKYLRAAWSKGLLGEGYRVVAYCPGCQTSLSNTEVGLGYETLEDPSIYFKFELEGTKNEFLVLWTTMPFTVVTDMLAAVNPKATYCKVKVGDEVWVLAKDRLAVLDTIHPSGQHQIIAEFPGSELVGRRYEHPLIDLIDGLRKMKERGDPVHSVVGEDFVDLTTGTGVVHISPGNGEEDFVAGQKKGLPAFSPFDEEAKFTAEAGHFAGKFCRDTDAEVIQLLRDRGALIHEEKVTHEYPTCWRSHDRLVFVAKREYYLWTDRINDKLVQAAEKVEYFYESPRNRFIAILEEARPWCISRDRYWGTPLPIFVCEACGEKEFFGSREEIVRRARELPDGKNFELHRPWVDRITMTCPKCGGIMRREKFVLDTWHNSGSAPYASLTDEEFREYVPVEFLSEAIDQTRGWANTLLKLNIILKDEPEAPYRAYLFYNMVVDDQGRKMSKSLGNVVDSEEMIDKYSGDLLRFYLTWKSSPIDVISFNESEMVGRPYQVLSTFYNLSRFFLQNAEYDKYDPKQHGLDWVLRDGDIRIQDRWVLSKLQKLVRMCTQGLETGRHQLSLREFENFVIENLSRGYVPSIRKDLWEEGPDAGKRRNSIYAVMFHCLSTLVLLSNPICPFISEYVHQHVLRRFDGSLPVSVNLCKWPKPRDELIDESEEGVFDIALEVLPLVNAARQKANLRRRWPLKEMVLILEDGNKRTKAEQARDVLTELANVKGVKVVHSKQAAGFVPHLILDYSRVGPKFKQKLASVEKEVKGREREIADEILEAGRSKVTVGGEEFELTPEDLVMSFLPPEGKILEEEHGTIVVLDTTRDEALIAEGLVRDVARRVQMTRKMAGLNPTEMLNVVHVAGLDAESKGLIAGHLKTLAYLVRSKNVKLTDKIPSGLFKASHSLDEVEVTVGFKKAPRKRQAVKKGKKAKPARRRKSSRTAKRVGKTK